MALSACPRRLAAGLLAAALALLSGPGRATEITVSAASSLTNAFREIALLFEAADPGTHVQLNFGASGALLQQIARGAPVDVYASADPATMDQAQAQGWVATPQRRDFATNALVVIVPAGRAAAPRTLGDLALPTYVRIAIGLPASVPVGRYTQGALEAAGLWSAIEPRMIGAHSARQALDYVARAEVDAGFVYATDAALMADKVRVAFTVPTASPIRYPIAVLAGAPNATEARRFVDFVVTPPARAALARHGFGQP